MLLSTNIGLINWPIIVANKRVKYMEIKAIKIIQQGKRSLLPDMAKDVPIYVSVMKAKDLLNKKIMDVDRWNPENPEGYQRPLSEYRRRETINYLTEEEGLFPTSILINIRSQQVKFEPEFKIDGTGEYGKLTLPDEALPLYIVDGQHRVFGIGRAIEDGHEDLGEYPLPVSITAGLNRFAETRLFYILNDRQKGVPTDIAQRNLQHMAENLPPGVLITMEGEARQLQSKGTPITDSLNENPASAWHKLIKMPTEGRAGKIIGQGTFVRALADTVLKSRAINKFENEEIARLLINYWNAVKELFPTAFGDPEYTLCKSQGLRAFLMIFEDIFELCREAGNDFSQEKMKQLLKEMKTKMNMEENYWHKTEGVAIGTNPRAIKALAATLRQNLPQVKLKI